MGVRGGGGSGQTGGADPGVLGTALGVVLAFSLAEGSWQWFSTYLGLTLLVVVLAFGRVPVRAPGAPSAAFGWNLAAYSLVVGLCVALALAPALQRWDRLFPMPGTRDSCAQAGRYESLHARAALADLAAADPEALAYEQEQQARTAVDDCLSATTTRWLPAYALGTAVLVAGGAWVWGRRREGAGAAR
ncbi:hypothetical protein SAMN05216371_6885 [Streptomyces sp. TLI_053]|uniref:hypothetical protein n=1 Tax=Streptomyces sp. TLI_053 TaxID=1855352 RepID=UPI00087B2923|nr:hypothetical protein [Streptomyces sp. TLI_053]SDT81923.1 hypothetical protein SAMN05216371_6885 [Streptomyces sp. TLI_053]